MLVSKSKLLQKHNQIILDNYKKFGGVHMGPYASYTWRRDPKHLFFSMARYKFCARILAGKENILEIGCGDAFGMPIMLQSVNKVHGIDIEPLIIELNKKLNEHPNRCRFETLDITQKAVKQKYDGAVCLDVIEHIAKNKERLFMSNIVSALKKNAVLIMGTPNIEAHKWASVNSREGHINLKSAESLKELLRSSFKNVFLFSMNDEIVHTGFYPMAHYFMGIGIK